MSAPAGDQYIFILPNSLELEQELKLRMQVLKKLSPGQKNISFQYIGMFAGKEEGVGLCLHG